MYCLSAVPEPTKEDLRFIHWSEKQGIVAPLLTCLTTSDSVGGRGLFASAPIKPGDVLASIPMELVIGSNDPEFWAADIASQVRGVLRHPMDPRRVWVESWSGGGCSSWDDIENLDCFTSIDKELKDTLKSRLERRCSVWREGARKFGLDVENDFDLYSLISSRACYLGPTWSRTGILIGVVPLFDMLNHSSCGGNVKLEAAETTFARLPTHAPRPLDLRNQDMLLIAGRTIETGKELLTEYIDETNGEEKSSDISASKIIQWGFI